MEEFPGHTDWQESTLYHTFPFVDNLIQSILQYSVHTFSYWSPVGLKPTTLALESNHNYVTITMYYDLTVIT